MIIAYAIYVSVFCAGVKKSVGGEWYEWTHSGFRLWNHPAEMDQIEQ